MNTLQYNIQLYIHNTRFTTLHALTTTQHLHLYICNYSSFATLAYSESLLIQITLSSTMAYLFLSYILVLRASFRPASGIRMYVYMYLRLLAKHGMSKRIHLQKK